MESAVELLGMSPKEMLSDVKSMPAVPSVNFKDSVRRLGEDQEASVSAVATMLLVFCMETKSEVTRVLLLLKFLGDSDKIPAI